MAGDLEKPLLYEGVKALVDHEHVPHLHLNQQKLFTLFSIGFQYLLFRSTKNPGAYIIRIENSYLADKLAKKSKDNSTRKFMNSLLLPRKLKYEKSFFYLDFFHLGSWNLTNDIPQDKIRGALIVKGTSTTPLNEHDYSVIKSDFGFSEDLPNNFYLTSLIDHSPKTITVSIEDAIDGVQTLQFPFIKKEKDRLAKGVTIASDLDLDDIDN